MADECKRCVRKLGGKCLAFKDAASMWDPGPCWGYTRNARRVVQELSDIVTAAERSKNGKTITESRATLNAYKAARRSKAMG